ncbi:MAG: sulfatase-like hydrolase/transferase, partial [Pirellulaceae bacterium]
MTRLLLLSVMAIFVCSASVLVAAEKPNIVWIFSDDHSYQTIGAYGGRLASLNPSPNIDRLAREGMRFDRAYVGNSICGPSRATLLTGKHSHLNGKYDNGRGGFDHDQQQFQKILQKNGYQTVMVGKIHLDGKMQGFDYWEVLPGQGKYYDPEFITEEGRIKYEGEYVSDVVTDRALDWLQNKRDKNKPFMLMI